MRALAMDSEAGQQHITEYILITPCGCNIRYTKTLGFI